MSAQNGFCVQVVRRELLEALAAQAPAAPSANTNGTAHKPSANGTSSSSNGAYSSRLLVDRWLQDRGIAYRVKPQPDGRGRTVYVLKQCPFDSSHGDPDSCVMQARDGKLSAQCFHNSCSGRGWQAFKDAIGKPEPCHYDPPLQPSRRSKPKSNSGSPSAPATSYGGYPLTDLGNAERLKGRHGGDLRHCHPWKKWFHWNKRYWAEDQTGAITAAAIETVRNINAEAAEVEDDKLRAALREHAKASESARAIRAMIDLARPLPSIPILPADMDIDPFLMNVRNGTIDLRTGQLRPHRREDHLTKLAPVTYDPAATCPLWNRCIDTWMGGSRNLTDYLRRVVGYSLCGDVSEQALFFFYGLGSNGKTTFLKTMLDFLGDYACQAVSELLMAKNTEAHPTERADLFGRRFVATIETDEGKRMAEALMKQLVGGDRVKARRLYQDFFEMEPTWKLFLAANHKPVVRGTDFAVWRRIRLVPFTVKIQDKDKDKNLCSKLKDEFSGILNWALSGFKEWRTAGLNDPPEVREATAEYQREQDALANFFAECCTIADFVKIKASLLLKAFQEWSGDKNMTQQAFRVRLRDKGFESKQGTGGYYFVHGIGLPADDEFEREWGENS